VARSSRQTFNGGDLGFEAALWQSADKLRGNLDAADYKHVVLGLIFLKYISDAFEEKRAALTKDPDADPEDRDEYLADNVFWVPTEARWAKLQAEAKQPTIGKTLDDAMTAIERDNPRLKGVLPKEYARPALDKRRLGELIDLIATIGLGDSANRSKDILGRVYEYFLGQFASAEGKKGGEFYTPRSVVRLLVEMLAPHERARIYDPCCGSGGMFVQSERFIEAHGGRRGAAAVFGQESNHTTWRLCQMNLAIRGIEGQIERGDTFHDDRLKDLRADFVLANPHFNDSDWGGESLRVDPRWQFGVPPPANANFAWVQHFIWHLAPNGYAGFVLANGSLSSNQNGEGEIRRRLVEADLVDCIVALPSQLFYSTQISVCLWFLTRNKAPADGRDRRGSTLFIDARRLGHMVDRTHRELTDDDVGRVATCYHAWRGTSGAPYADLPGFSSSATQATIAAHRWMLTPGSYTTDTNSSPTIPPEEFARELSNLSDLVAKTGALGDRLTRALTVARWQFADPDSEPDLFQDSELGTIPAGWRVASIYEIADVVYGAPFASEFFNTRGDGLPLLRIRDLATHSPEVWTTQHLPRETVIPPGDIVVGMDGEFRVHVWHGPPSLLNQRLCTFRPKAGVPRSFLVQALRAPLDFYEHAKTGTTVIHLGKADIDQFQVAVPPQRVLDLFSDIGDPLVQMLIDTAVERRQLEMVRDHLLPALSRGHVRPRQ
jgi:type I restriction enzyme M protein